MLNDSFELLIMLKKAGFLKELRDPLWWPDSGTYKVIIGAILTQQTKWEKVEKSLKNLEDSSIDSIEKLSKLDSKTLSMLIKPSGFYNTKAKYLLGIAKNIVKEFGSFEKFSEDVSREWLLDQRGIGKESADSILCYGCKRDVMVADVYSDRLLRAFNYEFGDYEEIKEWLERGVVANLQRVYDLYGKQMPLYEIFALFHGEIVEYCKNNSRGKIVDIENLIT